MNRSMNKRWVCGIWGVWLAAMVLCFGGLPRLATADEQDARAEGKVGPTAPPLAVAPFNAADAKGYQQAWAKHLGQSVEVTNSIGMKLVLIPPGDFQMGSPRQEFDSLVREYPTAKEFAKEFFEREQPQHRVRITKPYFLGMYEITQAEYERVMGTNPSAFSRSGSSSAKVSGQDTSRFPVERVSWEDAVEFCHKLSELPAERGAGRVYRLPTEAEWEYACGAGSTTAYYFGDDDSMLGKYAWYARNSGGQTHPVGQKKPNGWGLYDMHGNVREWCSDWFEEYTSAAEDDPTGATAGSSRVIRGGSWGSFAGFCRSASRFWGQPSFRYYDLGFRLAFSSVDQSGQ